MTLPAPGGETLLPITVILPTRNAMGVIEDHVRAIREWLPLVEQIVVVDSSEDGTLDYLRREIALPSAEFHSRPRGLYEGWNFGVSRARAEFIYFSTVGDTITREGLCDLLGVIRSEGCDIVISPPQMLDVKGEPTDAMRWPIHDLCERMRSDAPHVLSPAEAFIHSTSYIPATILGSSASNLYRTAFLQPRLFLEGWAHFADSAWMIAHCLEARIAVMRRPVARFVVHPKEAPANGGAVRGINLECYHEMFERAYASLRASRLAEGEQDMLAGWLAGLERACMKLFDRIEANVGYLARRDEKIKELGERMTAARARAGQFEEELRQSNEKVIALRGQLAAYERMHRRVFGVIQLYLVAKSAQIRKMWKWLVVRRQS